MSADDGGTATGKKTKAGAFDVRVIIGSLLGLYGVVLVIVGLVNGRGTGIAPHADPDRLNLFVGICLLIGAAAFIIWARVRPIIVPVEEGTVEAKRAGGH